jgi:hypothetical protein
VVEASFRSLNVRYGESGKRSARRGSYVLIFFFFQGAMPKSSNRQESLHTLAQHLMAQLPSLQEPCAVKVVLEERY